MVFKKPEVLIYNYSKTRIPRKLLKDTINTIWSHLPKNNIESLSIIAVTPLKIKKINSFWRKKNEITTIITFLEGDIFLCPKEIKKRAQKWKITEKIVYQKLLIHGILHLLGYTHQKEKERQKMEKLEKKIFALLLKNK
ncbi:MAG: rRNA maturation RNase YbeY [Minisyncoccia bacterium]|jgi:probable rRNA maturation factor